MKEQKFPAPPEPWPLDGMEVSDSAGEWFVIHQPSRDDEYIRAAKSDTVPLEARR